METARPHTEKDWRRQLEEENKDGETPGRGRVDDRRRVRVYVSRSGGFGEENLIGWRLQNENVKRRKCKKCCGGSDAGLSDPPELRPAQLLVGRPDPHPTRSGFLGHP